MKIRIAWQPLLLVGIAILAFLLRLYGLNWDDGHNFHPDERQILFRVTALGWPTSWAQFVNAEQSPLNPHFFAYGSFPLYLLALVGHLLGYKLANPDSFVPLTLLGRVISALFDSGTVFLTGLLTLVLVRDKLYQQTQVIQPWLAACLSALLLTFAPLHLQLAHFYAVDTILVFFVSLTLLACVCLATTEHTIRWSCIAALAFGLAMATKFSAAPLALPICVALGFRCVRTRDYLDGVITLIFIFALAGIFFVCTQPYTLLDFPNFMQQVSEQGRMARGELDFPYVRQFAGTLPYIYPIEHMLVWGLGATLGFAVCIGCAWMVRSLWKRQFTLWLIPFSWVLIYGAITGSFYVKFMRYMLPIYPALVVLATVGVLSLLAAIRWQDAHYIERFNWLIPVLRVSVLVIVVGGTIFQGTALLNVYSQPNTRIQASQWIYKHLPPGTVLTYEQWDDALPVSVGNNDPAIYVQAVYDSVDGQVVTGLDLYGDDTEQKAEKLAQVLSTVKVITMPTNRLDKSITRLPERYPLTTRYYQLLFSGELGFRLAAEFEVRPHLLGVTLDDSSADESYSVFDHPHARVFVRDKSYTPEQIKQKLLAGLQLAPRT